MRKQAGSSRIKAAGPKKNFSGPPVVGLLALAAGARAAILAAGLPAVIAAARAAACSLQLAGLAECHCTENKNERQKRDCTLHINLLLTLRMRSTNFAPGFNDYPVAASFAFTSGDL
jgi:hypothetical protein